MKEDDMRCLMIKVCADGNPMLKDKHWIYHDNIQDYKIGEDMYYIFSQFLPPEFSKEMQVIKEKVLYED